MTKQFLTKTLPIILIITMIFQATVPWLGTALAQESSPSAQPTAALPTTPSPTSTPSPSPAPLLPSDPPIPSPSPADTPTTNDPFISPKPSGEGGQPTTPLLITTMTPTLPPLAPTTINQLPTTTQSSARIRKSMKLLAPKKRNLQAREFMQVKILYAYDEQMAISVRNTQGEELPVALEKETSGDETTLTIRPPAGFKPGRYRFQIIDSGGMAQQQDFTWGVLAVNMDKSVYEPGETVKLALAVLDETGVMVCNAHLGVDITSPSGVKTTLGTWDRTITVNPECEIHDVTQKPDYETSYTIGEETGRYTISVRAETRNGIWTIEDAFDVRTTPPYVIARRSATRIVTSKLYDMGLTVTARQDFAGVVEETVPGNFSLFPPADSTLQPFDAVATVSAAFTSPYPPATRAGGQPTIPSPITSTSLISLHRPYDGSYTQTLGFGEIPENPLLTRHYKKFGLPAHDGIDIAMPEGTPVLAADDGEVLFANDGPYGITVILRHAWGQSYYGHLSKTLSIVNQKVKKGDEIALSGSTGFTTGPHLHFTIRPEASDRANGYFGKVDPLPYFTDRQWSTAAAHVQKIQWQVSLKAGQTARLGYRFDAPDISPQFYLLGPARLEQDQGSDFSTGGSENQNQADSPLLAGEAQGEVPSSPRAQPTTNPPAQTGNQQPTTFSPTPSSPSDPSIASPSAEPTTNSAAESAVLGTQDTSAPPQLFHPAPDQLVYEESRQWQIAADADVTITTLIGGDQRSIQQKPRLVFVSDQVGYYFYDRVGNQNLQYAYTTDGGATWTDNNTIDSSGDNEAASVWYDKWTPGPTGQAGDLIHIAYTVGVTSIDDCSYVTLDVNNPNIVSDDSIGTPFDVNASCGTITEIDNVAITRASDGDLYFGIQEQSGTGATAIYECQSNCTSSASCPGSGWCATSSPGLDDNQVDPIRLLPIGANSVMLLRNDFSANDIQYKIYNGSSWDTNFTNIDTDAPESTIPIKHGMVATLRRWNNYIYLGYIANSNVVDTGDFRTHVYDGSNWTQKTDVVCSDTDGNCSDALGASELLIMPDLAVDEESGDIYALYTRGSANTNTNVFYKKSTDGMANWSNETQLNTSNTNTENRTVFLPFVNSHRIYFAYDNEDNADIFGGTVVDLKPPTLDEVLKHGDWWSKAGTRQPFSW